jgi:death on curing protein
VQVPPYRLDECERGGIESALAVPQFSWEGEDKYPDLAAKAAALLYALAKSQACPDGNKRVALILVVEFLALNGSTLDIDPDELADMILETAEVDPATRDEVVDALTERLRPLTEPIGEDE